MDIQGLIWQEGWKPTTDLEVAQMLKLLSEKKKETERVTKSAREEIALLEAIGKEAEESYEKLESRINYLCEKYVLEEVDEEDRKETATTIKYKLARGEIVINKAAKTILKPTAQDEAILAQNHPEYVEMVKKFQWSGFKKNLTINDNGQAVDKSTGKPVDGISVVDVPQSVSIKLNV